MCELAGLPIGMGVYFFTYSTWQGKLGLYLEDLYISPEYQNLGAEIQGEWDKCPLSGEALKSIAGTGSKPVKP